MRNVIPYPAAIASIAGPWICQLLPVPTPPRASRIDELAITSTMSGTVSESLVGYLGI